jgi:outer membrane beta-barrel protein
MRSTVFQRLLLNACLVALVLVTPRNGLAENPLIEDAPPVMRARPLHDGRHWVAPQFGVTMGDPYVSNAMAGIGWRYYLTRWFGIGADLWAGVGITTSLNDDIERELSTEAATFTLSTSSLRLLANATFEFVPFTGKAMLFSDTLIRADVHIDLGIGAAIVAGSERIEDTVSIAPMFGVGGRVFPTRWLSVGLEVKDYLVNRALAARRDGSVAGSSFGHNWLVGLTVGFSFPMNPEPARDEP